ncbi:MAG: two-component regulator propeller domain-containing protein [Gemmatales bacterium]
MTVPVAPYRCTMLIAAWIALFIPIADMHGQTVNSVSDAYSSSARLEQKDESSKAPGKVVPELGNSALIVFLDKNNHYWFGSDGQGLYRYDGKVITHFTTSDGLSDNRIRAIQQDKSGNLFITTVTGINKFDGKTFTTLQVAANNDPEKDWRLNPDDLWFQSLYGVRGHNGPFRYDGKSLYKLKFPKHYLEDENSAKHPNGVASPYDVYFIYKDRRGSLWLGTGSLGVCRYDGKNFRLVVRRPSDQYAKRWFLRHPLDHRR